jgi:hypothetical protein
MISDPHKRISAMVVSLPVKTIAAAPDGCDSQSQAAGPAATEQGAQGFRCK